MNNISKIKLQCVGCRSCEQSCPKKCISMKENNEGFLYPIVDENLCIECKNCINVCPIEKKEIHRNEPQIALAWKNKNDIDIMKSASGGVADSATKSILQMGGVVYGAAYDEKLIVSHIEVRDYRQKEKLQSSKYVQSDLKDCYKKVRQNLYNNKIVLFTGTPCQIAGLYAFLGEDKENLYTIDLICHGVPSPKFFKKYLEYKERKIGEKIIEFNFRSKEKRGWGTQYLLKTKTKTKTNVLSLDKYGKHFMNGDCYRECCYQCEYANIRRTGDLTIGDFWGIEKSHPNFNSTKGVSSVLINTEKGRILFEKIKKLADIQEATLEEILIKQNNLIKPTFRPENRDIFYKNLNETDFIKKLQVGLQIKERIKSIIPLKIIKLLKSL